MQVTIFFFVGGRQNIKNDYLHLSKNGISGNFLPLKPFVPPAFNLSIVKKLSLPPSETPPPLHLPFVPVMTRCRKCTEWPLIRGINRERGAIIAVWGLYKTYRSTKAEHCSS